MASQDSTRPLPPTPCLTYLCFCGSKKGAMDGATLFSGAKRFKVAGRPKPYNGWIHVTQQEKFLVHAHPVAFHDEKSQAFGVVNVLQHNNKMLHPPKVFELCLHCSHIHVSHQHVWPTSGPTWSQLGPTQGKQSSCYIMWSPCRARNPVSATFPQNTIAWPVPGAGSGTTERSTKEICKFEKFQYAGDAWPLWRTRPGPVGR